MPATRLALEASDARTPSRGSIQMSKADAQLLARVSLPARPPDGFDTRIATGAPSSPARDRGRQTPTVGTEAHVLAGIPNVAESRRQLVADDRRDAGRVDERPRP